MFYPVGAGKQEWSAKVERRGWRQRAGQGMGVGDVAGFVVIGAGARRRKVTAGLNGNVGAEL